MPLTDVHGGMAHTMHARGCHDCYVHNYIYVKTEEEEEEAETATRAESTKTCDIYHESLAASSRMG